MGRVLPLPMKFELYESDNHIAWLLINKASNKIMAAHSDVLKYQDAEPWRMRYATAGYKLIQSEDFNIEHLQIMRDLHDKKLSAETSVR